MITGTDFHRSTTPSEYDSLTEHCDFTHRTMRWNRFWVTRCEYRNRFIHVHNPFTLSFTHSACWFYSQNTAMKQILSDSIWLQEPISTGPQHLQSMIHSQSIVISLTEPCDGTDSEWLDVSIGTDLYMSTTLSHCHLLTVHVDSTHRTQQWNRFWVTRYDYRNRFPQVHNTFRVWFTHRALWFHSQNHAMEQILSDSMWV